MRIKWVSGILFVIFLYIIVAAVIFIPILKETPSSDEPDTDISVMQTTQTKGDNSWGQYISVVNYNGGQYEYITAPDNITFGKPLGEVEIDLKGYKGEPDISIIASTVLDPGVIIHEWTGYSTEFRICARNIDGTVYCFERLQSSGLTGMDVAKYFPDPSEVVRIDICDRYPFELGIITDNEDIESVLQVFTQGSSFIELENPSQYLNYQSEDVRIIEITLLDGSKTEIYLVNGKTGRWISYLSLPDGFKDLIKSYEIYEGGGEYLNFGALYANVDIFNYADLEGLRIHADYTIEQVWVENGELRMGKHIHDDFKYCVLADDAMGFVRIENAYIWYLNTSGDVVRLRFWYPHDQSEFYNDLEGGQDMTSYITEKKILYSGPFISMQVKSGKIWTLDEDGELRREGKIIADDVNCFALDGGGAIYGRQDGLYRRKDSDGISALLVRGEITATASAGIRIYYATSKEEIRRIQVDGEGDEFIYKLNVSTLQCMIGYNREGLAVTASDGKGYFIYNSTDVYHVTQDAAAMEMNPYGTVTILHKDGQLEQCWASYEPYNGGLYFDGEFINPLKTKLD